MTAEATPAAQTLREEIDAALAERRPRGRGEGCGRCGAERARSTSSPSTTRSSIPLMVDTGAQWQAGSTRVWEEHFATATVRTIVDALYPEVAKAAAAAPARADSVLLACPPDEAHDLGLRMLADRFEIAGWHTHYLGANTPVAEIIDAARALDVDLDRALRLNPLQPPAPARGGRGRGCRPAGCAACGRRRRLRVRGLRLARGAALRRDPDRDRRVAGNRRVLRRLRLPRGTPDAVASHRRALPARPAPSSQVSSWPASPWASPSSSSSHR